MAGKPGSKWGWADAIDLLVGEGYALADVMGMTVAQLRIYSEAAMRRYRRKLKDRAVTLRAAKYDKSAFKAYLRKLDE